MKENTQTCPKCGYDQAGEIITWESQCPMEGRCPECGLVFPWADVFDPSRVDLAWYVEHADTRLQVIGRTLRTILMMLIPHRYWARVGVRTRVDLFRVVFWLMFLSVAAHVVSAIPVGMGSWVERGANFEGLSTVLIDSANGFILPIAHFDGGSGWSQFQWGDWGYDSLWASVILGSVFLFLTSIWLVILLVLPVSRSRVQLRKRHLVRAWMMTLTVVIIHVELFRGFFWFVLWLNGNGNPYVIMFSYLGFVLASILWVQWFWIAALKVGWEIRPMWPIAVLGVIASLIAGSIPMVYAGIYL